MSKLTGRLKREHNTLVCMTHIYCDHHHQDHQGSELCPDCARLMAYAQKRLEKCPYGENKPTCARCPIHCYKPAQREMARTVMRFAGPRMTFRHPWRSLTHLFDKMRRVEHPMKMRSELRRRRSAAGQDTLKP
ncbi:nitrous oxide-stimulated promoter family protein [Pseudomonadota bacterium]